MSFRATINIEGVPTPVIINDVTIDGSQINISYVDEATNENFVIQMKRDLPGNVPTKIGTNGSVL
jgi:hypothetical protein